MNLPFFISKRISKPDQGTFSSTIHTIGVFSIGLGLAVMILASLIMFGFQDVIKEKIYTFGGHLQVTRYVVGKPYEQQPIRVDLDSLYAFEEVIHVQEYAYKFGLLQNSEEVEGVGFKGIGESFDTLSFKKHLIKGRMPKWDSVRYSTEIVISKVIADRMMLDVDDRIVMHFIQNPPRSRRLDVVGIYETGMEDFDQKLILGDINLIRGLNNWEDGMVGGYEVFLKDVGKTDAVYNNMFDQLNYDRFVEKVSDKYIQIFEWLLLIDKNVVILMVIILFVASFNMVSIILIMILERTRMIGILKAVGAQNNFIRKIFVYSGMRLITKGLILGNAVGLGVALLQHQFQIIGLDPTNYYMSYVPIKFDWAMVIFLNTLVFFLISIILLIPTFFITRIQPIKAIQFD